MNQRTTLLIGTALSGLAVGLGAFGAHALKPVLLANNRVEAYETAVRYQFYHGLALLLTGLLMIHFPEKKKLRWTAGCFATGVLFFSGSLYALSFVSATVIALLTPVGGVFFLAGWVFFFLGVLKKADN